MTKNTIPTPHDRFFRNSLSNPKIAMEFMEAHLPAYIKEAVDLTTIQMCPGTFVDETLQLHLSDVLFSLKWANGKPGYIHTLFEHQSTPYRLMPFRRLQYSVKIMDQHYKEHGELPIVYTCVVYHGKKKYPYSTDLFDLFGENKALAEKTLLQPFDLLDLSQIPDEDLKKKNWLGMMELSLKHIAHRDLVDFIRNSAAFIRKLEQEGGAEYIRTVLHYSFAARKVLDMEALKQVVHTQLSPTLEKNMMTFAEQLREEGLQKGRQEGWQEGRQEGVQKVAFRLFQKGMPDDEIAMVTDLSTEVIQALREKECVEA